MSRKKQIAKLAAKDEPTVVIGSHLTVITYPDGKTELIWDDEALMHDVRTAIESAEDSKKISKKTSKKHKVSS
jgi:hypothetical protein